jgi:hypothetical protein
VDAQPKAEDGVGAAPTMPEELMEKISRNPRFKKVGKSGEGIVIVGAKRAVPAPKDDQS